MINNGDNYYLCIYVEKECNGWKKIEYFIGIDFDLILLVDCF